MAVMRRTLAIAVLACLLTGTAAASIYPDTSQALMPTPKEIGFTHLLAFQPAKKPSAAFAQGYKNGVSALYQKGTTKAPTEAVATAYVYSSTADAKLAWQRTCSKCKTESAPAGLRLKVEAGTRSGVLTLHEATTCGNVFLDLTEAGPQSASKLDTDVAKITNAVYTRAMAHGLSSCTAK